MMIEQNTNYAYKLKYMDNPTFDKVRDLSTKFYRELPQALQDELFEALNRGIDILDSEPQMTAYLFAFGKMHQAKLEYAFSKLPNEFLEQPEINIIDYGCGQALGTMCYADFLRENGYTQKVKTITLIEPSEICLKRAALHASLFFPDAEIKTVSKTFDELSEDDIYCDEDVPALHILSNVLDLLNFDLGKFTKLVEGCIKGYNQFICVGPYFNNVSKDKRMMDFASHISDKISYKALDRRELNPEKDWTCSILLCANGTSNNKTNRIELDCDRVFEEANAFRKSDKKDLNSDYCHELFYKLQICARAEDKRCQNELGVWCYKGIGTSKNHKLAIEWFFKSAISGYASAYKNIVLIYDQEDVDVTGKPVEKVFEYFENAVQNGDAEDKYFFALCYYYGIGVDINDELAFYWLNESAKQGDDGAMNALGGFYLEGIGVEASIEKAILSYTKAAKLGNKSSMKHLIKLFEKKEGKKFFGDEQFDIFVKAAQIGMKEILSILNQEDLSTLSKVSFLNQNYSYEQVYYSLIQSNSVSETENASFVFMILKNLSLPNTRTLGFFWRRKDDCYDDLGNSLFPYVYDSSVNIQELCFIEDNAVPSNDITTMLCNESFWEVFLLDNLEYFLPKTDHHCYMTRHIIFSPDNNILPKEIKNYIHQNLIDFIPRIDCLFNKIIRIQCIYYNAWNGLVRWCDYYSFQEIPNGKMKVTRLINISNQTKILYKYDCGIWF